MHTLVIPRADPVDRYQATKVVFEPLDNGKVLVTYAYLDGHMEEGLYTRKSARTAWRTLRSLGARVA